MPLLYYFLSFFCIAVSILPLIPNQHWIFRIWEFARIQVLILQILVLILGFVFIDNKHLIFWATIAVNVAFIVNHVIILVPYTTIYKKKPTKNISKNSKPISIISVNVYQFNKEYHQLITLIKEVEPDIILTMESNKDWGNALTEIEKDYPNFKKVVLGNTYGIHFYTSLKVRSIKVNYFVADDIPV